MLTTRPRILSVGTALPPNRYTQEDVLTLFGSKNPAVREIFLAAHIKTRHLSLPPIEPGVSQDLAKWRAASGPPRAARRGAMDHAPPAIARCL